MNGEVTMHNTQQTQGLTHLAGIAGLFVKYVARRDWEAASAARTDMFILINDQQAATVRRITEAAHRGPTGRTVTASPLSPGDWDAQQAVRNIPDLRTQIDRAQADMDAQLSGERERWLLS
jgi:hypothetical protein